MAKVSYVAGWLVRVSDFFSEIGLLIWRMAVLFAMPSPLPIWISSAVYNLHHHQTPIALIADLNHIESQRSLESVKV